MTISHGRTFKKMFRKHPVFVRKKFYERICLFLQNPYHPILNNHTLSGEWARHRSINITGDIRVVYMHRSINITGDIRVVYKQVTESHVKLVAIGTHSELYS